MEKIVPSKSGCPTASCNGRYIHSAYDPEKEAERFSRAVGTLPPGTIALLLGEGLGYLARRIGRDNPGVLVLPVFCSRYLYENRVAPDGQDGLYAWYPGKEEPFSRFLRNRIPGPAFSALKILEWEPAGFAFPGLTEGLKRDISRFSREANGSLFTTAVFGKKWITNALRNYLAIDRVRIPDKISGPVFIAASGPGLAEALPFLKRNRKAFSLWALPSAADFLGWNGLCPDGIIMTDSGFYTNLHFRNLKRRFRAGKSSGRQGNTFREPFLYMPLSACSGLGGNFLPVSLFHQGTALEKTLLEGLAPAPPWVPSNGTVAGSAVELVLSLGAGPVLLAGLDMAARGIEEHVRPNAFDEMYEAASCRLGPEESLRGMRVYSLYPEKLSPPYRTSPALKTYAGWFSSMADEWKGRVFRLAASPVDAGWGSAYEEAEKVLGQTPEDLFFCTALPAKSLRRQRAAAVIADLEKSAENLDPARIDSRLMEIIMMIDTAGVLELRKNIRAAAGAEAALNQIKKSVAEFSASLYSLLRAQDESGDF
jgi:hypothetical protein